MTKRFAISYDFCLEGVNNAWEAHGAIMHEADIETACVHNVEYIGDAPNTWPMLKVTFDCIETAKAYTSVYLGLGPIDSVWDVYKDDEVGEYISYGKFVD